MASLLIVCILFAFVSNTQAQSCIFGDLYGSNNQLDLRLFDSTTAARRNGDGYYYLYSPCRNNFSCGSRGPAQAIYTPIDDTSDCLYQLAKWENGVTQPYYDPDNNQWTFTYQNGEECEYNWDSQPNIQFEVNWKCNMAWDGFYVSEVGEHNECQYYMNIESKCACPGVACPKSGEECVFSTSDEKHSLNLTEFQGQSLSNPDNMNPELFYVYSPCQNSAECNQDPSFSMAYIFNTSEFRCTQSLAVWDNGITQPKYNSDIKSWQFVYNNGDACDGFEETFFIYWNCDFSAKTPRIVSTKEIENCVYEMTINSTVACL